MQRLIRGRVLTAGQLKKREEASRIFGKKTPNSNLNNELKPNFTIPKSALRIPHSALRIPKSALRTPHSKIRTLQ